MSIINYQVARFTSSHAIQFKGSISVDNNLKLNSRKKRQYLITSCVKIVGYESRIFL